MTRLGWRLLVCLLVPLVLSGCNKKKTPCAFTLAVSTNTVPKDGGAGGATVAPAPSTSDCSWTASSDQAWLSLSGATAGSAQGTFNFQAAANSTPSARQATITLTYTSGSGDGTDTETINQAGADATLSVEPPSRAVGDTAQIGLTAAVTSNTSWSAASDQSWLTITGGATGSNNGSIIYTVQANGGGSRTATVTVTGGGRTATHAVSQSGIALSFTDPSQTFNGVAHANEKATVMANVAWTAAVTSGDSFLSITEGASGTNDGTITFALTANPTASSRTGEITLTGGGLTAKLPIIQNGVMASFVVTSTGSLSNKCQLTTPGPTIKCNFNGAISAPSALITKYEFRLNDPTTGTLLGTVLPADPVLREPTTTCGLYDGTEVTAPVFLILTVTGASGPITTSMNVTFRKQGACGV
jgi:hypothetical protein